MKKLLKLALVGLGTGLALHVNAKLLDYVENDTMATAVMPQDEFDNEFDGQAGTGDLISVEQPIQAQPVQAPATQKIAPTTKPFIKRPVTIQSKAFIRSRPPLEV